MASYYFDTSALVKRYANEHDSSWVRTVTDEAAEHTIYVSYLGHLELLATIHKKMRQTERHLHLTGEEGRRVLAAFEVDLRDRYRMLEHSDDLLVRACSLVARHPLRGYDAMHLACALRVVDETSGTVTDPPGILIPTFVCADKDLAAAARAEGMTVEQLRAR